MIITLVQSVSSWDFEKGIGIFKIILLIHTHTHIYKLSPHERSLPPEKTAQQLTVSGQALPRSEKALQRHTEGLHEIFQYHPLLPGLSDTEQRQVVWTCQTWNLSLWNQKKHSNWTARKLRKDTVTSASATTIPCSHCSRFFC